MRLGIVRTQCNCSPQKSERLIVIIIGEAPKVPQTSYDASPRIEALGGLL
jgi:hypothetical protein